MNVPSVRLHLGQRMVVVVASIAVLLAGAYTAISAWVTRSQLDSEYRQMAQLTAAALAVPLSEAMITRTEFSIPPLLDEARHINPNMRYAYICDSHGQIGVHTFDRAVPSALTRLAYDHSIDGEISFRTLDAGSEILLHVIYPLEAGRAGYLHMAFSWSPVDDHLRRILAHLVGSALLGLFAAGVVGMTAYRRMARPIRELTAATVAFREGNRTPRVEVSADSDDEVALMGRAFNLMADRIQTQMSELRASHAALADEKTRIQAILDGMRYGVIFFDPEGRLAYWNRAAQMHWDKRIGPPPVDAAALHIDTPDVRSGIDDVRSGRSTWTRLQTHRGDHVLSVMLSVIHGPEDTPLGVLEITDDITEPIMSARALAHAEKLNVVGQLAAGVAHEINSPLDGAIEAARLMEQNPRDADRVKQFAGAQHASLVRIAAIVRRLLTFSRQARQPDKLVDMAGVVREAVELIRYQLDKKKLTVTLPDQGAPAPIRGDVLGLSQVAVNLLANAVDASPADSTIRVEWDMSDREMGYSVIDSGSGISPEIANRLFTPFFTTKGVGQGTGLGLAISLNIVHEHGGTIVFRNENGGGARFTVRLPKMPAPTPPGGPSA